MAREEVWIVVTVKDVLNLGIFEDIWLAAPCEGCEKRLVTGAGILDFEPFWGDYDSFTPGEFIFTSLGFAQRDPDLADQAVRAMIERDVAALVIKPVAMDAISAEAAELSTARGVPVFFYEGHFVERLMAAVLALVAEDWAQSQRDALIDALIAPRGDADVREGLFEVARTTGATVQCLAARPLAPDGCMLSALQGELGALLYDFQRNQESVVQACVVRYRDQLLAFVSYDRPPRGAIARSEADLVARIEAAGRLRCGVSQEVSLGQGDLAIRQARTALDAACDQGRPVVRWASLGLGAFRAAASADRLFAGTAQLYRSLLDEYDRAHGTELAATARAYAASFGEVRATAEALYQHPNTVRYRLRRIREELALPDVSDRELAALLVLAYSMTD